MIRTEFSRSFLRMGYDVSEVLTFLADVERTLTGQETDPDRVVTAQKALDVEFSVKLRGFNDEEVDAEIDRLIEMLRHAERRRRRSMRIVLAVTFTLRGSQVWSRLPLPLSMLISARLRPSIRFFVP